MGNKFDKPWMKYYDDERIEEEIPNITITEYMKGENKGREELDAIEYYGKKISYNEFFEHIDNASKILSGTGVSIQDRILYLMPNIPETAYFLYGTAQMGAVADYIDPRPESNDMTISANKILKMIIREKVKHIVTIGQCYLGLIKPIENELKDLGIENVILVSPNNSMNNSATLKYLNEQKINNGIKNTIKQLKKMKELEIMISESTKKSPLNVLTYESLLNNCKYQNINIIEQTNEDLCTIVHTSGTTSPMPKPITLTNENLNAYNHQTLFADMGVKPGYRVLHVLPYFAAFGLADVVHAGFCQGNNLIQIPEFSPAGFGRIILKEKPQVIIGTPTWFISLLKDPYLKKADLSFLRMVTYGGDSMTPDDELKVNEFLREHNSKVILTKGHGMSEICGCASYATNEYNVLGSMGIPMPETLYGIVDQNTKELLHFNGEEYLEGEIFISSKALTKGILDDEIIVPHTKINGVDGILTKDIARMDKNGILYFLSRSDRGFTRFDGYKYKPHEVEKVISQNENVKYCVVTSYYDENKCGFMPIAHIVLEIDRDYTEDELISITKQIVDTEFVKNPNISSRQLPSKFNYRREMPLTINGKLDFNSIKNEELNNSEINVDLEETNISLGEIKVSSNKTKTFTLKIRK